MIKKVNFLFSIYESILKIKKLFSNLAYNFLKEMNKSYFHVFFDCAILLLLKIFRTISLMAD